MKSAIFGKDIKMFQKNNGLVPDGIIGSKTRAAIWPERKHNGNYSHFVSYPMRDFGALESQKYFLRKIRTEKEWSERTKLPAEALEIIWESLTSTWETGFDYLSNQDGVTFGARRLAAGTLQNFLKRHRQDVIRHFDSESDFESLIEKRPKDKPRFKDGKATPRGKGWVPDVNGGFPMDEESLRYGFLSLARDPIIWHHQFVEGMQFIEELRNEYPNYQNARLILLLIRAANSARYQYTPGLPKDNEARAYRTLASRYSDTKTHKRRISKIEKEIPKDKTWSISSPAIP